MKLKILFLLLPVIFAVSGCVSVDHLVSYDKEFPPDGKYEILGPISLSGKIVGIIGLFWIGGVEFSDLGKAAEDKYKTTVDDIVSISVDEEFDSAAGIFTIINRKIRGIAIRYIKPPVEEQGNT